MPAKTRTLETILPRERSYAPWLTLIGLLGVAGLLSWRGYTYYRLGLESRVDHPDYRVLSPGGFVGHGYGIVGTALILTNLLYLARRRFAWLPVGSMRAWLDVHVFTGLAGSMLVLFHSAFQLRTPIATMTAVSLGVVVLTGLVGRYLYALTPKSGADELTALLEALDAFVPDAGSRIARTLASSPNTYIKPNASLFRVLFLLPRLMSEARLRKKIALQAFRDDPRLREYQGAETELFTEILKEIVRYAPKKPRAAGSAALLRSWREIHRFTAILMVLSVVVHVAVAWFYGYRWIFSK